MSRTIVLALLTLVLGTSIGVAQEHPAEKYGWGFINFGTPSFGWDIYRNSFYGIPVDSNTAWFTAPFDKLFYDLAFETTLADPTGAGTGGAGNCFGLSILSMMINNFGGYRGFCAPTIQYTATDGTGAPTRPGLLRAINIMHGHQISLLFIQSVIEQVNGGHALDAAYGVARAKQDIAREGPVLLSVTKSLLPTDGGHAIIAYDVEDLGGGNHRIKVVDPNRIWVTPGASNRDWYLDDSNSVHVNGHDWSFMMAGKLSAWPTEDPDDVAGATPGSGNLTIYPLSVAGPTSRTPSSLGLGVTSLLSQVFIMNQNGALGGRLLQFENGEGKRLFADSTRYLLDHDTASGIGHMVPFYPMATPPNGSKWPFELYFHRGPLNEGRVQFSSGEGSAEIVAGDNRGYVRLSVPEGEIDAEMNYAGIGGSNVAVTLGNASQRTVVDLEIVIPVQPGVTNRVWRMEGVELPVHTSEALSVRFDQWGGMEIASAGSLPILVDYTQSSLEEDRNFQAETLTVAPESTRVIRSSEWSERGNPGEE